MSIVMCKKTRRQFLVGSGSTLLALPFLPSLFSSEAAAQTALTNKKMMVFWLDHNPLQEFWPDRSIATTSIGSSGAMEMMLSSMASATAISPVLSHPMYDTIRKQNQLSIVRGLDVHKYGGHGLAALGGHAETNAGALVQGPSNYPTMDMYIENSPSVYPSTTPAYVTKAIRVDFSRNHQFLQKTGTLSQFTPFYGYDSVQSITDYYTIVQMYNDVFKYLTGGTTAPIDNTNLLKTNILNRVHESFVSFRSNRKISSDDIARLDQHMGFLTDLQKGFTSGAAPILVCTKPNAPILNHDPTQYIGNYLDLLVVAFKCGMTKFSTMFFEADDPAWIPGLNLPPGVGLHGAIHGTTGDATAIALKGRVYEVWNKYYLNVIADRFITPMNQLEGNTGKTYLDNMLTVVLTQMGMESTQYTSGHGSSDMQQMMIGSMGGALRAGRYTSMPGPDNSRIPYNTFMITLLQLMGVPQSEYSPYASGQMGFGYYDTSISTPYTSRFYSPLTELLA